MPDTVVLLHGLGQTRFTMNPMARALAKHWNVLNAHYPSRKLCVAENARFVQTLVETAQPVGRLHFVTHSMGGIIARSFAHQFAHQYDLGRAVTIGSPHLGASLAGWATGYPPLRAYFGPALFDLADLDLPDATDRLEIGIIASGLGNRVGYLPFLTGDNDGFVTITETRLQGAADWVQVRGWHPLLPMQPRVIRLAIRFLQTGRFTDDR